MCSPVLSQVHTLITDAGLAIEDRAAIAAQVGTLTIAEVPVVT